MFDNNDVEYDKAQKALSVLREMKANAVVNGISRSDIQYALEAAEIFQLPTRYPVNSFTAEPSVTNLDVALESLSQGQRIGISILTGVIVGLLAKIISYFFTGGSSGGSSGLSPYITKQNNVVKQLENLQAIAELEKEKNDALVSVEIRKTAITKALGGVEPGEYMQQHPYTRIAFETLCSHSGKFKKLTEFLGENQKHENLRNIYVFITDELNDSMEEMLLISEAVQEWVLSRRRGGNRERIIEPRLAIPGPILDKFIKTAVPTILNRLAANGLIGQGKLIDVTPPDVSPNGLHIPDEDKPLFELINICKFMNQLNNENTGIKFAENADYLERLVTSHEKLLIRVTSSSVVSNWQPLPKADAKDYDPMNRATKLNERFEKAYDPKLWNTMFSEPNKDGTDGDEESDAVVGNSWKYVQIYMGAIQSLYKESAILLKLANDVIAGMHDALRITEKYQKELTSGSKEPEKEPEA